MEHSLTCPECATPIRLDKLEVTGTPCEHLVYVETHIDHGPSHTQPKSGQWFHPSLGQPSAKAKDVLTRLAQRDFDWQGSRLEIEEMEWFVGEDEYHLAAKAILAMDAKKFPAELNAAAK